MVDAGSITVCPIGFALIFQVCPRSEEPFASKDYCTVPKVEVTLQKFRCSRSFWMGEQGAINQHFWEPKLGQAAKFPTGKDTPAD